MTELFRANASGVGYPCQPKDALSPSVEASLPGLETVREKGRTQPDRSGSKERIIFGDALASWKAIEDPPE